LATVLGVDLGGRDSDANVSLRSAGGAERPLAVLYSGPSQLNFVMPGDSLPGEATLSVRRDGWPDAETTLSIAATAPGVFTLNPAGLSAASLVRSKPGQPQARESVFQLDESGKVTARPIAFGEAGEDLSLVLYGTGLRGRSSLGAVSVEIGGLRLAASYAGPQPQYPGLDQINVALPRSLSGAGAVTVRVLVDGSLANTTSLTFQ
jgi:uncharacterized protein (TIGR03437 family)